MSFIKIFAPSYRHSHSIIIVCIIYIEYTNTQRVNIIAFYVFYVYENNKIYARGRYEQYTRSVQRVHISASIVHSYSTFTIYYFPYTLNCFASTSIIWNQSIGDEKRKKKFAEEQKTFHHHVPSVVFRFVSLVFFFLTFSWSSRPKRRNTTRFRRRDDNGLVRALWKRLTEVQCVLNTLGVSIYDGTAIFAFLFFPRFIYMLVCVATFCYDKTKENSIRWRIRSHSPETIYIYMCIFILCVFAVISLSIFSHISLTRYRCEWRWWWYWFCVHQSYIFNIHSLNRFFSGCKHCWNPLFSTLAISSVSWVARGIHSWLSWVGRESVVGRSWICLLIGENNGF